MEIFLLNLRHDLLPLRNLKSKIWQGNLILHHRNVYIVLSFYFVTMSNDSTPIPSGLARFLREQGFGIATIEGLRPLDDFVELYRESFFEKPKDWKRGVKVAYFRPRAGRFPLRYQYTASDGSLDLILQDNGITITPLRAQEKEAFGEYIQLHFSYVGN